MVFWMESSEVGVEAVSADVAVDFVLLVLTRIIMVGVEVSIRNK